MKFSGLMMSSIASEGHTIRIKPTPGGRVLGQGGCEGSRRFVAQA